MAFGLMFSNLRRVSVLDFVNDTKTDEVCLHSVLIMALIVDWLVHVDVHLGLWGLLGHSSGDEELPLGVV